MTTNTLQSTSWLAKRLGLSVSTIERLRVRGEGQLPPHLVIGRHTIRYDVAVVEDWLAARQGLPRERVETPAPGQPSTPQKKLFGKRVLPAIPA